MGVTKRVWGAPGGSDGTETTCNAGDSRFDPDSGGFSGEGNLQYSCLENFVDREAWPATVHGDAESDPPEHTL